MFYYIGVAIFGLIVGWIAEWLSPGKHPGGCIATALIGIGGSMLFQFISSHFLMGFLGSWHWIGAIVGTVLLLALYRAIFGNK